MNEFHSKEELFKRVYPALKTRYIQFCRLGYSDVSVEEIWNYLSNQWKNGNDLMLSDIVNDIMNVTYDEIKAFLNNENTISDDFFEQ